MSPASTGEILTEAVLSRAYGVPIRLIRSAKHVACVAELEAKPS
jgi:iron complex transport system ATP-binding protein